MPRITAALSAEDLARAERVYQGFAVFDNRLAAVGRPWRTATDSLNLDSSAIQAWTELAAVADDLQRSGNPLAGGAD